MLCLLSWLSIPCLDSLHRCTVHYRYQVASALYCYSKGIQPLQHNCGDESMVTNGGDDRTVSVELSRTATLASGRRLNGKCAEQIFGESTHVETTEAS